MMAIRENIEENKVKNLEIASKKPRITKAKKEAEEAKSEEPKDAEEVKVPKKPRITKAKKEIEET
jgi:hypothetical protein